MPDLSAAEDEEDADSGIRILPEQEKAAPADPRRKKAVTALRSLRRKLENARPAQ